MSMIPFNKPPYTGDEDAFVTEAMRSGKMSGDGPFTKKCQDWFQDHLGCKKALLTPSCTHALELAALLLDLEPGDEIIMPSYTFVSTANAFALRGAKIVFVDIRPDTMNIDESLIEAAITPKTKAIVPVHYAGVGCDMDTIMALAEKHGLWVIEDAAQGVMSRYKDKPLGSIGHMGCFSFHDTKNYTAGGEGGLIAINDQRFAERAEIIREKGTNRSLFFRGMVDKYSWVDIGSSYLPGELQAAYLWGQIQNVQAIYDDRMRNWDAYCEILRGLNHIELPTIPKECTHNAHMFYIKLADIDERTALMEYLKQHDIQSAFHYIPLHSAKAGLKFSRFHGQDNETTLESERLLRLPLWYHLPEDTLRKITTTIKTFF